MTVGLHAGHDTQSESTVSTMAICQQRSLCVSHTWRRPLVGHYSYVNAWGEHVSGFLNDHVQTCAAAAQCDFR